MDTHSDDPNDAWSPNEESGELSPDEWRLIDRYRAGECDPDERADVERLLNERPDLAATLAAITATFGGTEAGAPQPTWDVEAASARLARVTSPRRPERHRRRQRTASLLRRDLAVGAALVVVVATGRLPWPTQVPERHYATGIGERSDVHLADGTRIRLAPGSRVIVAAGYGQPARRIQLEGEAYFEVAHDAARPFMVSAARTTVQDVGTAFGVRAYRDDSTVGIVVRDGEVALDHGARLRAGDAASVSAAGVVQVRHNVAVDAMLGWTAGQLAYDGAPLGVVARDLSRWYGVDVGIADSAAAHLAFTGTLTGLSADAAVELVGKTVGLHVVHQGARLVLTRGTRHR